MVSLATWVHVLCRAALGILIKDKKKTKHGSCQRHLGTGGAVAMDSRCKRREVIILYPSGKVSDIQERQLTTWDRILES
jgi:threonine synthase